MHISITGGKTGIRLNKTDENRINEVRKILGALQRHSDDAEMQMAAADADAGLGDVINIVEGRDPEFPRGKKT